MLFPETEAENWGGQVIYLESLPEINEMIFKHPESQFGKLTCIPVLKRFSKWNNYKLSMEGHIFCDVVKSETWVPRSDMEGLSNIGIYQIISV